MRDAMFRTVVFLAVMTACVADTTGPSDEELAELDQWAATADGKADLPQTYTELVAWLHDYYFETMSAIWENQEHPATADAALARVRALVPGATSKLFRARVQRLHAGVIDHSEVDIVLAPGKVVRLVGDPKGAGAFLDRALFKESVGAPLCLTWSELEAAVRAAYAPGFYGLDFVCHTITERVLRALDVGSASFSSQIRTYSAARWVWGPLVPSFNSANPASWDVSRACPGT